MKPLVVCTEERRASLVVEQLRGDGWSIHAGWDLPWSDWDVSAARAVCAGRMDTPAHAHGALLAAARGAGVVAVAAGGERLLERFVEDLLRVGPVQLHHAGNAPASPPRLAEDERRLLELLAAGVTLGDAAARLHVSRRTADRRLARARKGLGVSTTAEALVAFGHAAPGLRRVA